MLKEMVMLYECPMVYNYLIRIVHAWSWRGLVDYSTVQFDGRFDQIQVTTFESYFYKIDI